MWEVNVSARINFVDANLSKVWFLQINSVLWPTKPYKIHADTEQLLKEINESNRLMEGKHVWGSSAWFGLVAVFCAGTLAPFTPNKPDSRAQVKILDGLLRENNWTIYFFLSFCKTSGEQPESHRDSWKKVRTVFGFFVWCKRRLAARLSIINHTQRHCYRLGLLFLMFLTNSQTKLHFYLVEMKLVN